MRRAIAILALMLAVMHAPAQQNRLDSLLGVLKTQPAANTQRMNTLIAAAKSWCTIDPSKGRTYAQDAGRIAARLGDDRARAEALMNESLACYYLGEYLELDSLNHAAEAIATRLDDPCLLAGLGVWGFYTADFNDPAVRTAYASRAKRSFDMSRKCGDRGILADNLFWIGIDPPSRPMGDSLDRAMAVYRSLGDSSGMAYCIVARSARFEPYLSDTEGTLRDLAWAITVLDSDSNLVWSSWAHLNRSILLSAKGQWQPALTEMLACLRASEALRDPDISATYFAVGDLYQRTGDSKHAMKYFRLGVASSRDPDRLSSNLNGIAYIFINRGMADSAMAYLDPTRVANLNPAMEGFADRKGLTGLVHLLKGDTATAVPELRSAIQLSSQRDGYFGTELRCCIALSNALLRASPMLLSKLGASRVKGDAEARLLAEHALDRSRKLHLLGEQRDALLMLSLIHERAGDPGSALRYHRQYADMKDSVLNADKARAVANLQIQYETEKKEQQIVLLGKDKEVQAKEIQKQKLVRNGFMGGFALVALFAGVFLVQRNRISKARKRSDELLLNILPEEVADELKDTGAAQAKHFDSATILFTDFKGFTQASEKMSPQELVEELNTCFKAFDNIITAQGIEKIKTIGDAYMCAGGLPDPKSSTPADVVHAALEMQAFMTKRKAERDAQGLPAFEMRVGIHTGPVVAGIVGVKKFQYDIWGDTVNTASRMESSGEVGQVNISEATYALVKSETGLTFTPRGKVQAKGKGEMEMYFVRQYLEPA